MSLITGERKGIGDKIYIHECYKYGHIWKIVEEPFYITSVCRICGKIGERKLK